MENSVHCGNQDEDSSNQNFSQERSGTDQKYPLSQVSNWLLVQLLSVILVLSVLVLTACTNVIFSPNSELLFEIPKNLSVPTTSAFTTLGILATLIVALVFSQKNTTELHADYVYELLKKSQLQLATYIVGSFAGMTGYLYVILIIANPIADEPNAMDCILVFGLSQSLIYFSCTFKMTISEYRSLGTKRLYQLIKQHQLITTDQLTRWQVAPWQKIQFRPFVIATLTLWGSPLLLLIIILITSKLLLDPLGNKYIVLLSEIWVSLLFLVVLIGWASFAILLPQGKLTLNKWIQITILTVSVLTFDALCVLLLKDDEYVGSIETTVMIIVLILVTTAFNTMFVLPTTRTRSPRRMLASNSVLRPWNTVRRYFLLASLRDRRRAIRSAYRQANFSLSQSSYSAKAAIPELGKHD